MSTWRPGPAATDGDDVFYGDSANDTANGLGGDDALLGGAGDDLLNGGAGSDTLYGGAGVDTMLGGDGDDAFDIDASTALVAGEQIDGGSGRNLIYYHGEDASFVDVDISNIAILATNDSGRPITLTLTTEQLKGITERLSVGHVRVADTGSIQFNGVDVAFNTLTLAGGDDRLSFGNSFVAGSWVYGGAGNDTITGSTVFGSPVLDGGDGNDVLTAGADTGFGRMFGGTGDDILTGLRGEDRLDGAAGQDTLAGGSNSDTLDGGEGHDVLAGGDDNDTLIGGLGDDTLDGGHGDRDVAVFTISDAYNQLGIAFTLEGNRVGDPFLQKDGQGGRDQLVGIEVLDVTGTAKRDYIVGGNAIDLIRGGDGDDWIDTGSSEDDTIDGGEGNDVWQANMYEVGGDISFDGGQSAAGVPIFIDATRTSVRFFDRFRITSGLGNDTLVGAVLDDTLSGGGGRDLIQGMAGQDTLSGGEGSDTLDGGDAFDMMSGGEGPDILMGMEGSDALSGNGVDGDANADDHAVDTLVGGNGDDVYYYTPGDVIIEQANGGNDYVQAVVSLSLERFQNVESLALYGDAYFGYGNTSDNTIYGTSGNNLLQGFDGNDVLVGDFFEGSGDDILIGGNGNDALFGDVGNDTLIGGTGTDTLRGGTGNDLYRDVAGDLIVEGASGGTDRVEVASSFSLVPLAEVENITLTGAGGFYGIGNALANTIRGNAGANALAGNDGNDFLAGNAGNDTLIGGLGADTLAGGLGDDVYRDVEGDLVYELAGQGIDRIETAGNTRLTVNIENLLLTGTAGVYGIGNELSNNIRGNAVANLLIGNGAADVLIGESGNDLLIGGVGRDTLLGGTGVDTIRTLIVSESTGAGRDTLLNFNFNEDRLDVAARPDSIALSAAGTLSEASFDHDLAAVLNAGRLGAHQAVLFDPTGGDLRLALTRFLIIDENGTAGYQAGEDLVFQLANMSGNLTLDDFV